jgi:hypothetical protein
VKALVLSRQARPSLQPGQTNPCGQRRSKRAPYTGSPTVFFGTILVIVSIGAFIPLLFGRETVGQLETFTEAIPEPA